MIRRGVLGGTFDPVHFGHLLSAEQAREHLDLDRVVFVPAGTPPHKRSRSTTPVGHRLRMLELAIQDNPHFEISRVDLDRPGPHYTADMLELLAQAWGPQVELWFIMGIDSLIELTSWHQPQRLIQHARLAVAERPGFPLDLHQLQHAIPGVMERIHFIPIPELEISSSDLQTRAREGRSLLYLVPGEVEAYIRQHRLYRA